MRVVGIHRYCYRKGGAEAVFLDHIDLLETRGWKCARFVMAHPENPPSSWDNYFPSCFDLSDHSQALFKRARRFFYSSEAKYKLDRLLFDFQPDIVHLHGAYHQLTVSILEPIINRRVPLVFTVHDFKLMCPAYYFYSPKLGICERCASGNTLSCVLNRCVHNSIRASLLYAAEGAFQQMARQYKRAVSAYVMPSKFILEKFRQHGFPFEKLHYIPNFFESSSDVVVTPDDIAKVRAGLGPYVLFFGRLSSEKGIIDLIDACRLASLPLAIAGSGPEEERLRQRARALGADVKFLGHLKGAQLWTIVEAARCVALPSVWYENAPKSVLEAQSRGKVVVASNIGGLPEMVEDGVTGYLFEHGNVEQLADKLSVAFEVGGDDCAPMGTAARTYALTTFTKDRYFREIENMYRSLLAHSASGLFG